MKTLAQCVNEIYAQGYRNTYGMRYAKLPEKKGGKMTFLNVVEVSPGDWQAI